MKTIRGFFRGLGKAIRFTLFVGALLSVLVGTVFLFSPTTADAIVNRIVGGSADIHDSLWAHLDDSTAVLWTAITDTCWLVRQNTSDTLWAHLDDSTAVLWTAITDTCWLVRQNTSDTLWAHLDDTSAVLWTALTDTAWMLRDAIHDSLAAYGISNYDQFWGAELMAIDWTTSDEVDVFFPLSEKFGDVTHPYFLRSVNSGVTDDQEDTVVFSGRLPMNFDSDVDSITFGYRTSTTTASESGVTWQVFAACDLSGYPLADTLKMAGAQVASGSAGVWTWLSVPIADSAQEIGAGSWIFVYAICAMDYTTHVETVDVESPYFWGSGK